MTQSKEEENNKIDAPVQLNDIIKGKSYKSLKKKLKKLNKKPFLNTISANKKKIEELNKFNNEIDNHVLALAPFKVRSLSGRENKDKKEKLLDEFRKLKYSANDSINDVEKVINDINESRKISSIGKILSVKDSITERSKNIKNAAKNKVLDFFSNADKEYDGLTPEEILDKVYAPKEENKDKNQDKNISSQITETVDEAYKLSEKPINTPAVAEKDTSSETLVKMEDRLESINKNIVLLSETIEEASKKSVDNQDTSIDEVKRKEQEPIKLSENTEVKKDESSFGKGFFGSLGSLIAGWLSSKIGLGIIGNIVKGIATSLISTALASVKGMVSSVLNRGKDLAKSGIKYVSEKFNSAKDFVKDKVTKVSDKIGSAKDFVKDKVTKVSDKIGSAKDNLKKGATKLSENVKSKSSNILKKLVKFAKPIPILGTALAAGSAIYSAVDGYNNASEILDKPESYLTETEKLASAAGAVVNDVSFGFVSSRSVAEKIVSIFGNDEKSEDESADNSTPAEKVSMEIPLDTVNASPAEKILINKIKMIQQTMTDDKMSLKNESDPIKIQVKKDRIEKYNKELINSYKEYNEKFFKGTPEVEKSNNMIKTERLQEKTVQNTKQFSQASNVITHTQPGMNTNFNINNVNTESNNFSAYDSFYKGGIN